MPDPSAKSDSRQPANDSDPRSNTGGASGLGGVGLSASAVTASGTSSRLGSGAGGRQTFAADELAIVLSHYDLGTIDAIQEYPRGSRKAPKLVIRSENGLYLLKRRAHGKDHAFKVAFCHGIQLHLAERQFPLPHLIGTRQDNNSMLQLNDQIYELFEYIKGTPYDMSLEATQDSGKILGLMHKLLKDYQHKYDPPTGSYHHNQSVYNAFKLLPTTMARTNPNRDPEDAQKLNKINRFLQAAYEYAVEQVEEAGIKDWPGQIVHSDWHPGNMLFRGNRVVAVIDYDASRIHPRIIDAANGALQFSIIGGGEDPRTWPEYIDESRFKRFMRGYDTVPDNVLSRAEIKTVPWLMIQALIAEAVIPIASTGKFARMDGGVFLEMVQKKVVWLQDHADALVQAAEG
ncbi:MAG: phosphotransferase [Planctomycetota bacterium]